MSDLGGDPACWLDRVCDRCGAFVDESQQHRCSEADPEVAVGVGWTDVSCSFCGLHNREAHMVGRDELRICSVCVARAAAVLDVAAGADGPTIEWSSRWPLKGGSDRVR